MQVTKEVHNTITGNSFLTVGNVGVLNILRTHPPRILGHQETKTQVRMRQYIQHSERNLITQTLIFGQFIASAPCCSAVSDVHPAYCGHIQPQQDYTVVTFKSLCC